MKNLYCIPKLDQINEFVSFSEQYNAGFEYNDFFLPSIQDDADRVEEIIKTYKALPRDRSEDILHGAFLDVCVHSDDSKIKATSDLRIRQSLDTAMELGCKAVIFHTNFIPNFRLKSYCDNWVSRNYDYWNGILSDYPSISIYLENMFDEEPVLLAQLAELFKNEPRFQVCLDFAHAHVSHTPLKDWIDMLAPFVRHLHINDNDGMEDSHNPVGSATLPWEEYNRYTQSLPPDAKPSVLIEVRGYENLIASVNYMKEHKMYPFI